MFFCPRVGALGASATRGALVGLDGAKVDAEVDAEVGAEVGAEAGATPRVWVLGPMGAAVFAGAVRVLFLELAAPLLAALSCSG